MKRKTTLFDKSLNFYNSIDQSNINIYANRIKLKHKITFLKSKASKKLNKRKKICLSKKNPIKFLSTRLGYKSLNSVSFIFFQIVRLSQKIIKYI